MDTDLVAPKMPRAAEFWAALQLLAHIVIVVTIGTAVDTASATLACYGTIGAWVAAIISALLLLGNFGGAPSNASAHLARITWNAWRAELASFLLLLSAVTSNALLMLPTVDGTVATGAPLQAFLLIALGHAVLSWFVEECAGCASENARDTLISLHASQLVGVQMAVYKDALHAQLGSLHAMLAALTGSGDGGASGGGGAAPVANVANAPVANAPPCTPPPPTQQQQAFPRAYATSSGYPSNSDVAQPPPQWQQVARGAPPATHALAAQAVHYVAPAGGAPSTYADEGAYGATAPLLGNAGGNYTYFQDFESGARK